MKRGETFPEETAIRGDSHEVMQAHYAARLVQLRKELDQLTVLEHPVQVQHICKRIRKVKDLLYGLNKKFR
jgi:L-alanine-DL-glutamate epimerase-like enolase superfamily enzyme